MPVPPEQPHHDDLAYHAARDPSRPVLSQVDEFAAYIARDFVPALTDGLKRNFPLASAALPPARWRQLGLAALGLLGVNWLIGLGPQTATSLVWLGGVGLAGYAGWHILGHARLRRRDELAQRFAAHTAELGAAGMEQRIAALAALDQLAYDHPRYRRPLVHLLAAWLDGRAALGHAAASGQDCAVARQMLVEFHQMLAAEPDAARPPVYPAYSAGSTAALAEPAAPAGAADGPALEVVQAELPAPAELAAADGPAAEDGPAAPEPQRTKAGG